MSTTDTTDTKPLPDVQIPADQAYARLSEIGTSLDEWAKDWSNIDPEQKPALRSLLADYTPLREAVAAGKSIDQRKLAELMQDYVDAKDKLTLVLSMEYTEAVSERQRQNTGNMFAWLINQLNDRFVVAQIPAWIWIVSVLVGIITGFWIANAAANMWFVNVAAGVGFGAVVLAILVGATGYKKVEPIDPRTVTSDPPRKQVANKK